MSKLRVSCRISPINGTLEVERRQETRLFPNLFWSASIYARVDGIGDQVGPVSKSMVVCCLRLEVSAGRNIR